MGVIFCRGVMLTVALIAALTLGTFVPVAFARVTPPPVPGAPPPPNPQPPAPFWPSTSGQTSVVTEWYSDIPWHQKLGTQAGNEIDEALVLPYEAMGTNETNYCKSKAHQKTA
jgi:hypothetical protein